jgi:ATP-dependent helicase/nuclease subunit A
MSAREPLLLEADANQARASDPNASAWVSANAGTGKTAVLVKRSLRLLLAGAPPESILCLTYTKTAAAEMENRLLEQLAGWATLTTEELSGELTALMTRAPEERDLRVARRLFAKALEAKGGLKIHTIHGFCERLLQRFPLESGVTPHFAVLDEHEAALLKREAFDFVVAGTAVERESGLGMALDRVITLTTEDYFRQVVNAVLAKRTELARVVAYHDSLDDWAAAEAEVLKRALGVADVDEEALTEALAAVLSDSELDAAIAALSALAGPAKADKEAEGGLREARRAQGESRAAALRAVFLTQKGDPRTQVGTAALRNGAPDIAALLDAAKTEFARIEDQFAHLRVAEASGAVIALADAIQADYERRKRVKAALDYDDLILKAHQLLSRTGAAAWVLYKIDGGIDHILVDEAQDTNPEQWAIIEQLAEEFFSGQGATETLRTLFAVGDEKQSIYSFQGADPARFGAVGRAFRKRATGAGVKWHEVPLNVSFRSTVPVLDAVDSVFEQPLAAQGLTFAEDAIIKHHAYRKGEAGLVEVWPVETLTRSDSAPPFEPWNEDTSGATAVNALCGRISTLIRTWLDSRQRLLSKGRPIKAGDILILVRRRDPFTAPMIRALKRLNVPVAGADRMRLMDQIAVQDLIALADVLLMPEDDLALAVVLKSPLFGLDDDALFALAHGRTGSLWAALKPKAREDQRFAEAEKRLSGWLSQADFLPPFEFFSELLGGDAQLMRKRMLTRLGPEAAEAIDEFLDAALAYDGKAAPSLQGFVNEMRGGDINIKRDMDQERNEVRIMTVHGAKGLESPIVFLPDTCMTPHGQGPRIFALPRPGLAPGTVSHLVWPPTGHSGVSGLASAKTLLDQAERAEYHRLLYVAMTRAQDRLYICGWQGQRHREKNCWYDLIEEGLRGHLTEIADLGGITVRRMECAQEIEPKPADEEAMEAEGAPLPDWALTPAKPERVRRRLTPSRLGLNAGAREEADAEQPTLGPKALADNSRYARGQLVHALLQHLPGVAPENQEKAAGIFIAARGAGLAESMKQEIVSECLAIVRCESFAPLFQPGSFAEVPVVALIGEGEDGYELEGQIDRLAILGDELVILDYKTNRPAPATPEEVAPAYIGQLSAYRLALRSLFPRRSLRAALLWTDGPRLMEIPSTLLDGAERRMLHRSTALTP